jgi:hypothetical protein
MMPWDVKKYYILYVCSQRREQQQRLLVHFVRDSTRLYIRK